MLRNIRITHHPSKKGIVILSSFVQADEDTILLSNIKKSVFGRPKQLNSLYNSLYETLAEAIKFEKHINSAINKVLNIS